MIIYQNNIKIGEFKWRRKNTTLIGVNVLQDGDRIDISPVYKKWFDYTNLGDVKVFEFGKLVIFLLKFPPFIAFNKIKGGPDEFDD